ncbi:MAG: STAS domain-containing protein, partial [Acidobacteria bacterium]|nr:STAS domain-containing protein [Acidobacteriota bacterium]
AETPSHESSPTDDSPWILWIAENDEETHLAVRGRGTGLHCEKFRQLAQASLETGRRLIIDLSGCTHLDSAFLGTLHEIVTSTVEGRISVLTPCEAVRRLFAELGLKRVLDAIQEEPAEPPCPPSPVRQDPPARESQQRLLRAHEVLSELSDENRERFAGVVAALRAELGEDAG